MSDHVPHPSGDPEPPKDPWAPPGNSENKVPLDKPQPQTPPQPQSPVHDQQTVTAVPEAPSGAVPGQPGPAQPGDPQPGSVPPGYTQPGFAPPGFAQPGFAPPGFPPPGSVPPPPIGPNGPGQAPGAYGYPSYPGAGQQPGPAPYGGYPGYPGYGGQGGWGTVQRGPENGFGTAALVLGIISVVFFCGWGLGIILGGLALIFGILGRKRANRGEANNGGMALAGIILGSVGILFSAAFLSLMIWTIANSDDSGSYDYGDDSSYSSALATDAGR
ncbi:MULTISPECIES: DUF4190 domain-containing protein [unclassified Streptomyces]|uniref:DUF4190 domain-containing protein n=1 Tax=unclassified Streptomyces TaxID=2593676 RepID=UPI002DDAC1BB|nr:DUF4190 domain-containing protein [Streptomyces sp. NBC_01766]WSC19540.1 DUF4190 domain-containing protein [Streptomyces sp. NBC_01766]WSV53561.1 DUF4190 domain-containing protein [Streptomyces sp. NBC_01014]